MVVMMTTNAEGKIFFFETAFDHLQKETEKPRALIF